VHREGGTKGGAARFILAFPMRCRAPIIHFSAQPETFLSRLTCGERLIAAQKVLRLSRKLMLKVPSVACRSDGGGGKTGFAQH